MVLAAAAGFGRVLGPKARAVSWFLGGFGASMIVAAMFPADPVDGFPVGTPEGYPTSISTPGLVHFVAGTLGFTFLGVSCFIAAWAMSRRHAPSFARLSFLCGLAVLLGFFGGAAFSSNSAGILGICSVCSWDGHGSPSCRSTCTAWYLIRTERLNPVDQVAPATGAPRPTWSGYGIPPVLVDADLSRTCFLRNVSIRSQRYIHRS